MSGKIKYAIAISGKAGVGKNTVANLIVQELGINDKEYKIVALADPMKYIIKTMFVNAKEECLFGPSELRADIISDDLLDANSNPLTYRQALLDLGKFGRKYNNNIWIKCLINDFQKSNVSAYVVSDVRMSNELEILKTNSFNSIRVLRDRHTKIDDISETQQNDIPNSKFDFIINNDGTQAELQEKVKSIVFQIKHKIA